jgi:hypothetical protein
MLITRRQALCSSTFALGGTALAPQLAKAETAAPKSAIAADPAQKLVTEQFMIAADPGIKLYVRKTKRIPADQPFAWPKAEEASHAVREYLVGLHDRRMESRKHGFKRMAAWLMPRLEQLLRFFDFGEILPRIEIDEDWREHLGYGRRSAICDVKARKSKCAAQLESLRLLASSDFQGSIEGIFGGGNVRRLTTQQKLTTDTMQFCI